MKAIQHLFPGNHLKGANFVNTATLTQALLLAAPYRRRIGKVTYEVSSFGNPQSANTAGDLLLRMLEEKVRQENFGEEAQSA